MRKTGYYFVEYNNFQKLIAYYNDFKSWMICGQSKLYYDKDFSKINEEKIDFNNKI